MKIEAARKLVQAALQARKHARARYSRFKVGAALLTRSGRIFSGANVESASYGLTCCAERVALFHALTAGMEKIDVEAIAVVARVASGPTPCGACRQLLAEYAPGATVLIADSLKPAQWRQYSVQELLPNAFTLVSPTRHARR